MDSFKNKWFAWMKILLLKPVAMVEGEESSAGIGREVRKEHLKNLFSLARGNFVFEWGRWASGFEVLLGVGAFFVFIHGQV